MMYGELYQYFIHYKKLNVPGIGIFMLEKKPATTDFPNKLIHPPVFSISLHHGNDTPPRNFFNWLAQVLQVSDRDAVIRFNDFAYEMKRKISAGDKIKWEGMGILSSGLAGEIRFEPALKGASAEAPVKAEKVIRENAAHTVRVGEEEKTSIEMIEYLSHTDAKKNYWWAWALAVGLIVTMFIGWYLSEHGLFTSSTGNAHAVQPIESPSTYKLLPQ
jgi:hypothetical protein